MEIPWPETAIGSMRVNTTTNNLEVYEGTRWIIAHRPAVPKTWAEWFDYYIDAAGNISDQYTRQVHIQQEMQARFPGRYRIDLAGQAWKMVFDTPADETWFHLQHD